MKAKPFLYTAIILLPFFSLSKSKAQNRERHRSVTINQTVVDGKVVASDTIITYTDTTTRTINSKEVSAEMPYTKGSTVYIDNSYRKLNIKQSKDGKVRLVTTTFFYGQPAFTNEQWLEKLNIQMKNTDSGIVVTSGGITSSRTTSTFGSTTSSEWNNAVAERNETVLNLNRITEERNKITEERNKATEERNRATEERNSSVPKPPAPPAAPSTTTTVTINGTSREVRTNGSGTISGSRSGSTATILSGGASNAAANDWWGRAVGFERGFSSSVGNSTAVFDEKGNNVYNSSSLRRELTLYIPADANLNVVSKYADVNADYDLKNLKIKVTNGSLDMVNADNATIISTYSNVSAGNITNADISATTGKLSLKSVDQLTLNTKYAKVEIDNCNTLKLKSTSDDYDLDVVKSISGTQNYGKLRLNKLTGSFDLKGSSGDVKIRNIEPSVSAVTLDNKYADVRFPVSNLKNYEVVFSGNYSSVFAPFERMDTTIQKPVEPAQYGFADSFSPAQKLVITKALGTDRKNLNSFSAAVGDTKGTHTKFNLTCTSCNVDFK